MCSQVYFYHNIDMNLFFTMLLDDKQMNGKIRKVCSLIDLSTTVANNQLIDGNFCITRFCYKIIVNKLMIYINFILDPSTSKTITKNLKKKTVFGSIHRSNSINVLNQVINFKTLFFFCTNVLNCIIRVILKVILVYLDNKVQ